MTLLRIVIMLKTLIMKMDVIRPNALNVERTFGVTNEELFVSLASKSHKIHLLPG